ncbi:MAG: ABC transporter permease [Solirubrobacterales bacterium]|nr:ABC transporter permease [Solirubrobacterales bacterium]
MSTTTVPRSPLGRLSVRRLLDVLQSAGLLAVLIVVFVVVSVLEPHFISGASLKTILVNSSQLAVCGVGMTMVIALRGIDLSVGSVEALAAVVAAKLSSTGTPLALAIAIALLAGLVAGTINGLIITQLRVPAFVATLGMLSIAQGVALLYSNGGSFLVSDRAFTAIGRDVVLGVPLPFVIALLALIAGWVLFNQTRFGRHTAAAGDNEEAAIASGIRVRSLIVAVFAIVGLTAALAGVLVTAQVGDVDATVGMGFELNVIAVVVLGGTSLAGGRGNLPGTVLASVLVASINAALNILGVQTFYQYLAVGLLLILALALEAFRDRLTGSRPSARPGV